MLSSSRLRSGPWLCPSTDMVLPEATNGLLIAGLSGSVYLHYPSSFSLCDIQGHLLSERLTHPPQVTPIPWFSPFPPTTPPGTVSSSSPTPEGLGLLLLLPQGPRSPLGVSKPAPEAWSPSLPQSVSFSASTLPVPQASVCWTFFPGQIKLTGWSYNIIFLASVFLKNVFMDLKHFFVFINIINTHCMSFRK